MSYKENFIVSIFVVIYNIILISITLLGTGYAVFVLNKSGWWFLLAFIIVMSLPMSYTYNGENNESK